MDGPLKGQFRTHEYPKFEFVVFPEPERVFDVTRVVTPVDTVAYEKFVYLFINEHEITDTPAGWYLAR